MAERPDLPPDSEVPEARVETGRWRWAFLIWVVPVTAVLIGAWLGARALLNQGPLIGIEFKTATGLEAGKTSVRYKDVDVGVVSSISLSEDRKTVIVQARMRRDARPLLVEDTRFWVVRPRITGGQAFGLGTLLTGAYIALDPGKSPDERTGFTGLEIPPVVATDAPGRQFVLRADDMGSVDVGSPVYYRRVRVGQTVSAELDRDGKAVSFRIFVDSPYDQFVTQNTRFWNASGIDMQLATGGFRLETQSLQSILIGGLAFQTPAEVEPGAPAAAEQVFTLYRDRETALKQPATVTDVYILHFDQSVRGLNTGSPVDFKGVVIGEVAKITIDNTQGLDRLRPAVEIHIFPERIAAQFRQRNRRPDEPAARAQALQRAIQRGLRAQLRTGNYITGQLYITLDFFPNARRVKVNTAATPPEIPTVSGGFEELTNAIQGLATKLESLPYAELVADIRTTLKSAQASLDEVNKVARRVDADLAPDMKALIADARATLDQGRITLERAQGVLSEDAPLQGDLRTTLRDVTRAAEAIRSLADYLERHPESLLRGKREETK
jgi:paraquat-inducible protein B